MPQSSDPSCARSTRGSTRSLSTPATTESEKKSDPCRSTTSGSKDETDMAIYIIDESAMDSMKSQRPPTPTTSFTSETSSFSNRLCNYIIGKKNAAAGDIFRLLGILIVAFVCIICIAMDIERQYFTSILTFLLGFLVDSPLNTRRTATTTPPSGDTGQTTWRV